MHRVLYLRGGRDWDEATSSLCMNGGGAFQSLFSPPALAFPSSFLSPSKGPILQQISGDGRRWGEKREVWSLVPRREKKRIGFPARNPGGDFLSAHRQARAKRKKRRKKTRPAETCRFEIYERLDRRAERRGGKGAKRFLNRGTVVNGAALEPSPRDYRKNGDVL